MKALVTVTLKQGVLDPQGKAIEGALTSLGFDGVSAVRQGKLFEIELDDMPADQARDEVMQMCERLLANTVIETYLIEIAEG